MQTSSLPDNHLRNSTEATILLVFSECCWIILSALSQELFDNNHFALGTQMLITTNSCWKLCLQSEMVQHRISCGPIQSFWIITPMSMHYLKVVTWSCWGKTQIYSFKRVYPCLHYQRIHTCKWKHYNVQKIYSFKKKHKQKD